MKKVSYLKSGIRDPRKFVDINDLSDFKTEFESFIDSARASKISKNLPRKLNM